MSAAPASPAAEPLSEPARIINTFVAPTKTFADLKRVSRWWSPFIVLTIASYALIVVAGQRVGWEQITENGLRMSPKQAARLESVPAEQRPAAMERAVKFTRIISYAFPIAINLPFLLIVCAILMASFNYGAGAEIPFRTALGVVAYANLPGVLKAVLAIVALLAGSNPESFNFQNPVATNPGYFMDPAGLADAVSPGVGARCNHDLGSGPECARFRGGQQVQARNHLRRRFRLVHRYNAGHGAGVFLTPRRLLARAVQALNRRKIKGFFARTTASML